MSALKHETLEEIHNQSTISNGGLNNIQSITNFEVKKENQDIVIVTKDILQSNVELKFSTTSDSLGELSSRSRASRVRVNIEEHNTTDSDNVDLTYNYSQLMNIVEDVEPADEPEEMTEETEDSELGGTSIQFASEKTLLEEQLERIHSEGEMGVVCRHKSKDKQTSLCHIKSANSTNRIYKCINCNFKTNDECEFIEHGDCKVKKKTQFKVSA